MAVVSPGAGGGGSSSENEDEYLLLEKDVHLDTPRPVVAFIGRKHSPGQGGAGPPGWSARMLKQRPKGLAQEVAAPHGELRLAYLHLFAKIAPRRATKPVSENVENWTPTNGTPQKHGRILKKWHFLDACHLAHAACCLPK